MGSRLRHPGRPRGPTRVRIQGGMMKVVRETPASDSPQEWLARERAHFAQVLYRYTPLVVEHSKGYYRERYEPFLPSIYHVPYPYAYRNPSGPGDEATLKYVFDFIDEMLDTRVPPRNVAAFIVEPVLGEGGYVVPPADFMPRLRKLCDRHDILLIADEVQSGYGRTGKMFACEHTGVVPDIMTLAKSIASGLPLSAVVATSKLMDKWEPAAHGSTFGGNPVSCAAGIATLDVFEREGILANAAARGAELMGRLRDLQRRLPAIGEVRGLGLMVGVELVNKDGSANKDLQKKVRQVCLDSGVVVLSCGAHDNVLRLVPPLNLSQAELDEGWEILNAAFQEVAA